jgi:hypothetical protein
MEDLICKEMSGTKIRVDPRTKTTFGVEFVEKHSACRKRSRSGNRCLNSPHLSMLSGVGTKKHFRDMNILVIQDL